MFECRYCGEPLVSFKCSCKKKQKAEEKNMWKSREKRDYINRVKKGVEK